MAPSLAHPSPTLVGRNPGCGTPSRDLSENEIEHTRWNGQGPERTSMMYRCNCASCRGSCGPPNRISGLGRCSFRVDAASVICQNVSKTCDPGATGIWPSQVGASRLTGICDVILVRVKCALKILTFRAPDCDVSKWVAGSASP
jgi:hypothetical protein